MTITGTQTEETFDHVIIGSGFGGSVSAMRLTEKGYRVLVLERGKRFRDQDFATTNWNVWKFLWLPALRWIWLSAMQRKGFSSTGLSAVSRPSSTTAPILRP